jgi:hypothetical protein
MVNVFESLVQRFGQQLREYIHVEHNQFAAFFSKVFEVVILKSIWFTRSLTRRYLTDSGKMPIVELVANGALHEHGILAQTLGKHL